MDKIIEVDGKGAWFDMMITKLSKLGIFLGYDWLRAMNPLIDWISGMLTWRKESVEEKPQEGPEQAIRQATKGKDWFRKYPDVFSKDAFTALPP
jgi:hypothetical protein